MTRVCVLGLGEAGGAIGADLAAAGAEVHGYDPAPAATPAGVQRHDDPGAATAHVDLVMAVTTAADATPALVQALATVPRNAIYADLSSASPALKRHMAEIAAEVEVEFVDVALMAPVPGRGLRTPALAAGPAAKAFAAIVRPLGMPVEVAGDEPGAAATRKLLRSVVMKGLAALLIETLRAADAAGLAEETWDNLVTELSSADEALVRRLVAGTEIHARRRLEEMEATVALLTELGVDATMTRATVETLRRL